MGGGTGIQGKAVLDAGKDHWRYDRLMGVCNTAPLFRRLVNTGLDLVIGRRFSALNHCPNIEFVFQDAEHRHSGPFRHFVELEAGFEVQPNGFLILHGRQYALAVELVRDSLGAHTIQLPAENLSNSFGGSFVNDELVFILRVLTVAIGSKGTDKIAISALYSLAAADLDGDILGIGVVEQRLFGKGKDKQAEIQYSCGFVAGWLPKS